MLRLYIGAILCMAVLSGCKEGIVRKKNELKVGVLDVAAVFEKFQKSQRIYSGLEKQKEELEAKQAELAKEIDALERELDFLSEEARKEREARIKEKKAAMEEFQQDEAQKLLEKTGNEYQKLMGDIEVALEAVVLNKKLTLVLDNSSVAYFANRYDITEDVITELNKRFK